MPQRVKAPDGTLLEFPDSMSEAAVLAVMRREYPSETPKSAPKSAPAVVLGSAKRPIEWTPENARTIKPLEYFRYKGEVYQHTPGAPAPGAPPASKSSGAGAALRAATREAVGAALRAATREAVPTVAGGLPGMVMGAGLGAAAGTAAGLVFPPAEVVTVPLGTLAGGLFGAFAGHKAVSAAQEALLARAPEQVKKLFGQDDAQRQADIAKHPLMSAAGAAAPGFAIGRPSLKANELVLGGAFGAGAETMRQSYAGEKPNLGRIATMGAMGAAQSAPTRAMMAVMGTPETAFQRGARETVQPQGRRAQRSRAEASAELRGTQATLKDVGVAPRPVDVMGEATTQKVLAPAGAASDEAARLVQKYGETVRGPGAEGTQAASQRAAAELAPETPGATAQELATKAAEEITAAGESVQPGVRLGEASTSVAKKLAAEEAAAQAEMRDRYKAQEEAGVATVELPRPGEGPWKPITPQQAQQYAKGVVNDPNDPLLFNALTSEVRPRSAVGPLSVAEFNAGLRDPISGFMEDPDSIKPVLNVLNKLEQDSVSTLDTSNLFGARKRLSAIERDFGPATPQGIAAGRVRRKLDEVMGLWHSNNRFSGAPEVLQKMGEATAAARKYYSDFRSGDIVQQITEQQYARGARETALDPEAARKVVFGTLKDTNTSLGNLKVLRDRLGANSPEWNALRQEAVEQLVGTETDKGKFIKNLEKFERENPAMADLLLTPAERATFTRAKGRVEAATDVQAALKTVDAALTALPADFGVAVSGLTGAPLRAAKVALRSNIEQRLGTPEGAIALLDDLARGTAARENVTKLLGSAEADKLFRRAEVLVQRQQRAESAGTVVESARRGALDVEGVRAAERGATGATFLAPLMRYLETRGMSRSQALQTARDALDPSKTEGVIKQLETLYGESAAQAFLRRVRANMTRSPLLGGLPRRVGQQAVVAAAAPPGEEPEASKDEAAPEIGEPPSQEQADEELFKFFDVKPDAKTNVPPPPKPPTKGGNQTLSLGERNNNLGNLKAIAYYEGSKPVLSKFTINQPGYQGYDDRGFAIFDTVENGTAAQERLLTRNYSGKTISQIVQRYTKGDPEKTQRAYMKYLAGQLGLGVNDIPRDIAALAAAMRRFETGGT